MTLDQVSHHDLQFWKKVTAHDALRCLINLSSDPLVQQELDDMDFINYIGLLITVKRKNEERLKQDINLDCIEC